MLDSVPVAIIVGITTGYLAGLGVGGGSLLILWLTLLLNMPQSNARIINLLFFLVCASTVSFFRFKQGTLQIRAILPAIIAGCIAAGLFSWLSRSWDVDLLKKAFGVLLLFAVIRELLYRPEKFK